MLTLEKIVAICYNIYAYKFNTNGENYKDVRKYCCKGCKRKQFKKY